MANNYQQFSTVIPFATTEQRDWLLAELGKENGDGFVPNTYGRAEEAAVWVYAEECGDIGALADLVARYQEHFALTEPWVLTWADWCSKMRIDEFSGGAVVVYQGTVKWFHPSQLADGWIKKQRKRKEAA